MLPAVAVSTASLVSKSLLVVALFCIGTEIDRVTLLPLPVSHCLCLPCYWPEPSSNANPGLYLSTPELNAYIILKPRHVDRHISLP